MAGMLVVAAGACAVRSPAPGPGSSSGPVPDLRGARVMLFPVQSLQGVGAGVDAELAFALTARGRGVDWVLPAELARALAASPGMDTALEGLPVGAFLRAEVRRVGDPLYGQLRRAGALVAADVALLPVVARYRGETVTRASGVEIAAALISVRSGDVLWFGVVEGEPGDADDPRALATAADALGRRLSPFREEADRATRAKAGGGVAHR